MKIKTTKAERLFDIVNYSILSLLGIATLYPLVNVLAISLSSYASYVNNPLMIFPQQINLEAYKRILSNPLVLSCYENTLIVVVVGTILNVIITLLTAYPLAKDRVRGHRYILFFIIFTMLFNGGLIPTYLVVKNLGLINSLWALILPASISTYNFILVKSFFESISDSIEESAKIDGAGHIRILTSIIIPLSSPVIATISLFYGVANWNRFFEAVMYINERTKWTLTLLLREIITDNSDVLNAMDPSQAIMVFPKTVQSATIIIVILPILCLYPFVQKYFIKGIMLGAVKG